MNLKNLRLLFLIVVFIVIATSSCNPQTSTSIALNSAPTNQQTDEEPAPIRPTDTPSPSATLPPIPSETPTSHNEIAADPTQPTSINTSPTPSCSLQAEFIRHLNVSDNTAFKPGDDIAKIWLVKNVGSCTWSTDFKLVRISGDLLQGPQFINLPRAVAPGETIEIRLNLIAPDQPDAYTSSWMLSASDGSNFGIGPGSSQPLQVIIVVKSIIEYDKPG